MNMKNKFRLIGFGVVSWLLLSIPQLDAQTNNPGPRIGIKGGANLSQFYVEHPNLEDENAKLGLHFGVFTKIPVNSFFAVQPELLYTNVGSKVSYGGSGLEDALGIRDGEIRFNLNYVQLPIAFTLNLGPVNIHAGPYLSYLISANVKNLRISDLTTIETNTLERDDFNSFDYGIMGGIGFDVQNVTIGVRYNYGLREVGRTGLAGNITQNSKNSVGQLYLGFGF